MKLLLAVTRYEVMLQRKGQLTPRDAWLIGFLRRDSAAARERP